LTDRELVGRRIVQ